MGYVELVGVLRLRPARTPDFAQNDAMLVGRRKLKAWNRCSEPLLLYSPRKAMVRGATAGVAAAEVAKVAASNRATFGMRGSSGMGYVERVGVLRLRPARTPDFAQNDAMLVVEECERLGTGVLSLCCCIHRVRRWFAAQRLILRFRLRRNDGGGGGEQSGDIWG